MGKAITYALIKVQQNSNRRFKLPRPHSAIVTFFRMDTPTQIHYKIIDGNNKAVEIAYGGGKLYERHQSGALFIYEGPGADPEWTLIAGEDGVLAIVADENTLYKLDDNGIISRYDQVAGPLSDF
jgi:hypothetical protein